MLTRASLVCLVVAALIGCGGGSGKGTGGTGGGTAGRGGAGGPGGAGAATAGTDGGAAGSGGTVGSGGSAGGGGAAGAGGVAGAGGAAGSGGSAGNGAAGAGGAVGNGGSGGSAGKGAAGAGGAVGSGGSAGSGGAGGRGGSAGGTGGVAGAAGTGGSAAGTGGGAAGTGGGSAGSGGSAGGGGAAGAVVDAGTDALCASVERPLAAAPDILIVLDASGTMNNDAADQMCTGGCGANSKWALTTAGINQVVATTQGKVSWGLKISPDQGGCGVLQTVSVAPATGNFSAIQAALAGRTDSSGGAYPMSNSAPIRGAVNAAAANLSSLADGAAKSILLLEDGLPTCLPGASTGDDSTAAIKAVSDAHTAGIGTYVVGIGSLPAADATLSQMATAGGYARAGSPGYYPVSSTVQVIDTLNQIVKLAQLCHFSLGVPPAGGSFDAIEIFSSGTPIPRDLSHTLGWDYSDPTHHSIDLHGLTCDAALNGTITGFSVVFDCPPAG